MRRDIKISLAIVLLAVSAVAFGVFGTFAPPLAEESGSAPQQQSASESVGHFQNPPTYDSGWFNATDRRGENFVLTHNLNTTEALVDVVGRRDLTGREHKLFFGTTLPIGFTPPIGFTYGGTSSDVADSVIQTSDGGYAIAGLTYLYDFYGDFWLVKTHSAGTIQWNQTYGGTSFDRAYSVIQTSDGGYALAGRTDSYDVGNGDFWLVKTDAAGNRLWNQTYGGASTEIANSVVQTTDGGYALAGRTFSYGAGSYDFWLVKTDEFGNALWNKTFGGTLLDYAYSLVQTVDGGYAVAGFKTLPAGTSDFWLVKTDGSGVMQWDKTYGGGNSDWGTSIVRTGDGGYAVAGYTLSFGAGSTDFWLVKIDAAGNVQWSQSYGGVGSDQAWSIVQTADGGYALVGYTNSYGAGGDDFWLVRTDSVGTVQWNQTYGGGMNDRAWSVIQTRDGGYVMAGQTSSGGDGFWLVKYDFDENVDSFFTYGLSMIEFTNSTITLYRGSADPYWNYVRVRIWLIKEPAWIYGDINMDGIVDSKDLYIIGRNYGHTFSLISLSGLIAVASIHTVKTRKQQKPHNKKPSPTEPLEALWQAFQKKKDEK